MNVKLGKTEPLIQAILSMKEYPLPFKTAYKLGNLLEVAEKHREFYNTELKKLIEQYGQRDENGGIKRGEGDGTFMLKEDMVQEFGERLDELMGLDVDYPDVRFDLYELESLSLTILQVNALTPFLNEENTQ